ncbi:MAG: phosphatidate cytidylyltransferase [Clostridia bacterium]|nr:phosphatidate cytidylyltransferase [Clostridia bacterium]
MLTRIITAIAALCLFVPICIFSDTIVLEIAMAVLNVVAVWEIWHCVRGDDTTDTSRYIGSFWLYLPVVLASAVLVFVPRIFSWFDGQHASLENRNAMYMVFMVFICLMLYTFAVVVFSRGKIAVTNAAVMLMMSLYVTTAFVSILCLRSEANGAALFLLPFIGAWVSDTFAYFTGRLLGKHKLIPEVSPKKTVEGAIGGIVFTAVGFVVFGLIVREGNATPNFVLLAVSGAIVSVISQIGDLIASVVKRHYGIKDYGKLFPGHGGVMDRFDSVMATAPVLYMLTALFPNMFM